MNLIQSLKKYFLQIGIVLISMNSLFSQQLELGKGIQFLKITHYSKNDFQTDAQFWAMTKGPDGIYYFGNNDGIIIFDGERWTKINLPNSSSVRSLCTGYDGKIYVGGYNEFGTVEKNELGKYFYKSLNQPNHIDNENLNNLWQIHSFHHQIIYRAFEQLIILSSGSPTHITTNTSFIKSEVVNNHYLVQEDKNGIMELEPESNRLTKVFGSEKYDNNEIIAFLPWNAKDSLLIATKNGNLYKGNLKTKKIRFWKSVFSISKDNQLLSAVNFRDKILLGTLSSKIILLDKSGKLTEKPPQFANLFNSSILNLYTSNNKVWALLNNGLDLIEFNPPFSNLFDEASIYDILLDKHTIYLATNKGIYYSPLFNANKSPDFKKLKGLEGQAWAIQKIDKSIIISHDRGLFLLKEKLPVKISEGGGFWKVTPIPNKANEYLASNYSGVYLLKKNHTEWSLSNKISGFNESTRDILKAEEKNTYWICHGYKGVYKVKFNETYNHIFAIDHFTDNNGFKSPFNINVRHWKDTTIFTSNNGIYTFNYKKRKFEAFKPLNKILGTQLNIRTIVESAQRTWVVQDDEIAYFNNTSKNKKLHKNLFLDLKGNLNKGMESILPLDKNKVLIGAKTGLFLYNINPSQKNTHIDTKIVEANYSKKDSMVSLPITNKKEITLPTKTDILKIEFATPKMSSSTPIQYRYQLKGIDNAWSPWQNQNFKEYTHLSPGSYTFRVSSRNLTGAVGKPAELHFRVPPMWYQTRLAIAFYILLFILANLGLYILVDRKIKHERKMANIQAYKSKKLLQLEIEQLKLTRDKERIKKDKELLEEDNIEKSKELANYTMLLIKKKDIFSDTYKNLKQFRNTLNTHLAKKRLNEVLMKLNQHRIGEEYMNVFDVHFEKVHKDFFKKLKRTNPNLTKRELRLCAFVKMNLTNKEIAPLLNISVRGVETARYRVRKKLNMQEASFNNFFESLSANPEVS